MSIAYAYCMDCAEMTHGALDQAKGFRANAGTNTHWDHDVVPFGDVSALDRPLFDVITRLGAGLPISDNKITMFRLGLDLHGYPTGAKCQPARSTVPGVANTSPTCAAPAPQSAASTRSLPASTRTSHTPAPEQLGLDFEAAS